MCGDRTCNVLQLETCQTCSQNCGSCTAPLPTIGIPPLVSGSPTPTPTLSPTPTIAVVSTPTASPQSQNSPQSTSNGTSAETSTTAPGTNNSQSSQSQSTKTGSTVPANAPVVIPVPTRQLRVVPQEFPDGRVVLPNEDVELVFTREMFGVTPDGWVIIFPAVDTNVVFNFNALLEEKNGQLQVVLPDKIVLEKPIGEDQLKITLPKDVVMTVGETRAGEVVWDGKFNGPKILAAAQACHNDQAIHLAIEVGRLDRQLLFSEPVTMEFPGKSNYRARYCFDNEVYPISAACPGSGPECSTNYGSILQIQTKHFTQFLVYKQTNWYLWGTILGVTLLPLIALGIYLFRRYRASVQVRLSVPKIVHELRTPLTAIKGYLAMILQGDYGSVSPAQKGPLVNVMSSTQRLSGIVNDMLDESSLEAGKIKLRTSDFAVDGVVQEVLASLQSLAKEKNLALTSDSSGGAIVLGDKDRVRQILTNLISNAIKFTDKGSIHISSAPADKVMKVFVTNTGPVMTAEQQQQLFKKFEQLGTKASGTGLGLYVSRELARAMGGDLSLEKSVPGEGTTFAFSLPLANLLPLKES